MARLFDDAQSEYLSRADTLGITAEPLTFACWFNSNDQTIDQVLMAIADADADRYWGIKLRDPVDSDIIVQAKGDTAFVWGKTSSQWNANQWHHVCGIFTSDTSRDIFIDGGSKGSNVDDSGLVSGVDIATIGALEKDSALFDPTSGRIAEAAVWNVALTDAEVAILAKGYSPLFVRLQNLVAYWPLLKHWQFYDNDRVGGYKMTPWNTPSWGDHPPVIYPASPHIITFGIAAEEEEEETFAELIAKPSSEKVFLLEVNPAQEASGWILTDGQTNTYEISYLNETITLADSTTETIRKIASDIKEDGTALTEKTSIATVEANAGTYWHDTANAKLYVHPTGSDDPAGHTMIIFFWLYFGTKGIVLNNTYYEPYIAEKGIPSLSQKNLNVHWGVANIGSGSVKMLNGRGYFDQISRKFIWTNKTTRLLMGGELLPYSEYQTLFTGKFRDKTFTKQNFILKLKSMAFDLLRTLPINNFWTSDYPNLDEGAEGQPIPYFYGSYSATQAPVATCINTAYDADAEACSADYTNDNFTDVAHGLINDDRILIGGDAVPSGIDPTVLYYVVNKTDDTFQVSEDSGGGAVDLSDNGTNVAWRYATYQFRICDHAIKSITQVYVDYGDGNGWGTISHANENLTDATFTIVSASFVVGTSRIKVSFEGKHDGGTLIENPPSIAEDILTNFCGYAAGDLLASSFTTSKARTEMILNVPIEKETKALSIIQKICASDLAFFDEDGDGKLRYRTWEPELGTVPVLDKHDILEKAIPKVIDDTVSLFWKIKVAYSYQCSLKESLYVEEKNAVSRYKYEKEETLTHDTYLRSGTDASRLGQRFLFVLQDPSPLLTWSLKATQIKKTLGDKLKITLARAPIGTAGGYKKRPFEIFGISKSFFPLKVKIDARDLPDYASNIGFWTEDSMPDYADATEEQRAESGFWTDDDGYADPTDEDSRHKSRWW